MIRMGLSDWWRNTKYKRRVRAHLREIDSRAVTPKPHGLDAPLVVSLTSFPPRFPQLVHTLRCLLTQTVAPDAVVLWCAKADMAALTPDILALQAQGLTISACEDVKSYKKLVPALLEDADRYVATADDDLFYPANWLERLVETSRAHPRQVIAYRVHKILYQPDGTPQPYVNWPKNLDVAGVGPNLCATGVGGVLYPPRTLHPDVTRAERFMTLCPSADDIWFYWMARLNGTLVRHTGHKTRLVEWPGTQEVSLRATNVSTEAENGNDRAIAALIRVYGLPPHQPS